VRSSEHNAFTDKGIVAIAGFKQKFENWERRVHQHNHDRLVNLSGLLIKSNFESMNNQVHTDGRTIALEKRRDEILTLYEMSHRDRVDGEFHVNEPETVRDRLDEIEDEIDSETHIATPMHATLQVWGMLPADSGDWVSAYQALMSQLMPSTN